MAFYRLRGCSRSLDSSFFLALSQFSNNKFPLIDDYVSWNYSTITIFVPSKTALRKIWSRSDGKRYIITITWRRPLEKEKKSRAISRHDFFSWIERNFSLSFFLHFGTKIDRSRTLDHVVWNIWDIYQKKKKKLIGGIFISWDRYIVLHKQNAIWH